MRIPRLVNQMVLDLELDFDWDLGTSTGRGGRPVAFEIQAGQPEAAPVHEQTHLHGE